MTRAQREDLERRFARNSERVLRLFTEFPPEQLTRRPAPGAWSAAECVVHLTLAAAAMIPRLSAALRELEARGARRDAPDRMDWIGRLLCWSLDKPSRFRSRTGAEFEPAGVPEVSRVAGEFARSNAAVVEAVRAAQGLDTRRAKIRSPFNERVRYNLFAAFNIIETHERRHLAQAERALGAPRSAGVT